MASKLADYLLQNPLYATGAAISQQGTSTAPVRSPMEGLARALQGGLGGLTQGYALAEAKGEQTADQTALAKAMQLYATNPTEARNIVASRPNLSDTANAMMISDVADQRAKGLIDYKDKKDQEDQTRAMAAFGITPPGGMPAGGGNTQVAGGVPPAQAKAEAQKKIQYLVNSHGIPSDLAATMVGNLYQESGFNPNAVHDGGTGYGMGGWRNERRAALLQEAQARGEDPSNPTTQLDFYANEFKTRPEYQQALQAQTPEARQAAMMAYFRPAGYTPQNPQGGHGFANRVQYAQQFSGNLPAQGSADGQTQPPQALNVPAPQGDTIDYQGLKLPRAEVTAALMIPDKVKRQEALMKVVSEGVKQQRGPDPGTDAGDVHLLSRVFSDPSFSGTPEYAAAHARASKPTMSQGGQLLYPDMSVYPKPMVNGGQPVSSGQPRFEDTPSSRFQMEGKLADDFNRIKSVGDYREVLPMVAAIKDAATRNNKVADLNMVYGLAKLYDPTGVVRTGDADQIYRSQSIPDWLKGYVSSMQGGSGFTPEMRQRIIAEAEGRLATHKEQYDALASQFTQRAKQYGLNPDNILMAPGGQAPAQGSAPAAVPVYDLSGKRIK